MLRTDATCCGQHQIESRHVKLPLCEALDMQAGWYLSKPEVRKKAREKIEKEQPMLIIGNFQRCST